MIPINMGTTWMYYILILSGLSPMGTTSGYIVTQDLYIVPALAMEALENSLWFSLASIKPSDSDCKVALTVTMIHEIDGKTLKPGGRYIR
jgi:hypothetical protein